VNSVILRSSPLHGLLGKQRNIQIEKAMKLAEGQIEIMKEDMSEELIKMLMTNWHCSMDDAMDVRYNSDTFSRLEDDNTCSQK
jgi:hypothetical protein